MGTISRTRDTTGARPTKSRALPTPVSPRGPLEKPKVTCAPPPSCLLGRLEIGPEKSRMCLNLHRAKEGGAQENKKKETLKRKPERDPIWMNNNVATVLRPPGLTLHIRQPDDRDLWHCIRHAVLIPLTPSNEVC
ncbi:uncharacterized protein BO96DRAFT_343971 [Aspergillus niger CBS 101883]|uniref:Contig An14c0190, genomic contig n=2 Tax=Aspergillus niger TaxID=5061 RepID=A2R432_ASPNC|nr:uncharacterized protein BO96DRAFT_343971 [Aspergillus niger CBS 101883]XP_059606461.1 uncharacterized protein An14g06390 [Aspergillus niger]PYH54012.1 hypothetical protein BO96DRAFT_343971 [Aspergillus niger CBS 101883]CAK97212.1 unnamed protein product [Aspergillus niger]